MVMLSPVLAARNMGEASLLPPLPSSTHNFLEQLAAKLPVECGVEIVGTLFGDGRLIASCCSNLFLAVTLPYHKEVDPSIILAKSEKNGPSFLRSGGSLNKRYNRRSERSNNGTEDKFGLTNPCGVGWVWRDLVVNHNSCCWSGVRAIDIAINIVADEHGMKLKFPR
ncbi:hypothetical protein ACOSQ3_021598 [Xanthoceras sorbifolium]